MTSKPFKIANIQSLAYSLDAEGNVISSETAIPLLEPAVPNLVKDHDL